VFDGICTKIYGSVLQKDSPCISQSLKIWFTLKNKIMALVNAGTLVNIGTSKLPSGYTKPTVTPIAGESKREMTLTIAKSVVENAAANTTMANILAQIVIQVDALVTADYDTVGLTVDVYTRLTEIDTNFDIAGELFTDAVINYLCTVEIFVKTT